jgi:site-specific DNA recombinase
MKSHRPAAVKELRAALYARVSSKQQAEANTIASQLEALQTRIGADGLVLETELSFIDEGYSGGTLLRPALERLRDQAAAGSFDRLYVHSPDRLARNYPYQVLLVEELQRQGIDIVFLNHAIGQTPEENLLLQVQGMMAEYERAKILERSRRGKRHAARCGSVNVLCGAPYGYRYLGKYEGGGQARYEIIEEQAEIVRLIFSWIALERCSIGAVCRRLQEKGILSPRGKNYWDRSTVWGLLQNPAYIGKAHFGKTCVGPARPRSRPQRGRPAQSRRAVSVHDTPVEERIPISVPALVDEALFAATAEQLAENRQRRRESRRGARYLLQGLVVCGQCGYAYYGKPLSRSARKGKPRDYAYYRCIGCDAYRFGGQRICTNKQCRTDQLDKAVWTDVCALLADPQRVHQEYQRRLHGQRKKTGRPEEQVQRLLAQVRRGITRLIDAYQDGYLERTEFESRMNSAKQRLAKLEKEAGAAAERDAQEQNLQVAINQLEKFAQGVREGLHEADWDTRRDILRALIKQVEVGTEAIRVVYKVAPHPFELGPERGRSQDCWRGPVAFVGESVYAPVRRGMEAVGPRGAAGCSHCQLRRRLRDLHAWQRRRGDASDAWDDGEAEVDGERKEDAAESLAGGCVHVPGVHIRLSILATDGRGLRGSASGRQEDPCAVSRPQRADRSANVFAGSLRDGS